MFGWSGVQVGFDLQHDLNLFAQCDAAAGDRSVIADPEVGAVDVGGCREPGLGSALWACAELGCLQGQGDRLRDATDGQVAVQEGVCPANGTGMIRRLPTSSGSSPARSKQDVELDSATRVSFRPA